MDIDALTGGYNLQAAFSYRMGSRRRSGKIIGSLEMKKQLI